MDMYVVASITPGQLAFVLVAGAAFVGALGFWFIAVYAAVRGPKMPPDARKHLLKVVRAVARRP